MAENQIKTLSITELLGMNFYIPEYQRGYRWTKTNVLQLLNDIWDYRQDATNRNTFYCLQPIVVRKFQWADIDGKTVEGYELIDGQQRLTTIHRILTFILLERYNKIDLRARGYKADLFSIYYKTRLESKSFLESTSYNKSKPDLYYMSEASVHIKEWFNDSARGIPDDVMDEVRRILLPFVKEEDKKSGVLPEWSVQVIWYEIMNAAQKSEDLFTRLNRGKIPLTSAELIKAKFVNEDSFKELTEDNRIKQRTQLIQIWDEIENQLNNPKFWAFISNFAIDKFSNKIEYLFDIITRKNTNEQDPLYSFVHFFRGDEDATQLWQKWIDVEEIYRSLVYWYSEKDFYHKVGYLIATGTAIGDLIAVKKKHTKKEFQNELNKLIAKKIPENWEELSFDRPSDKTKLINVLLLVNVELTRSNAISTEFFPFEMYKSITKSLEHIHAQNIADINSNKKEEWLDWIRAHTSILLSVTDDQDQATNLIAEAAAIDENTFRYEDFRSFSEKVLALIPKDGTKEIDYLHKIENMALLGKSENSSLSNSVFEVKRRKIIEMDRNGAFIPLATKRVFLKYYSKDHSLQYSVWTASERIAYLKELRECIEYYKPVNVVSDAQ